MLYRVETVSIISPTRDFALPYLRDDLLMRTNNLVYPILNLLRYLITIAYTAIQLNDKAMRFNSYVR